MDILGHRTWVSLGDDSDHDSGHDSAQTIVLLHGGLSNSDAMLNTIGQPLGGRYRVAAFDRRGHGRTADTGEPFHYSTMADETIAFLELLGCPAHLVGWSDGGNVGLLVALRRPDLIRRLVMIGSNYHHDGLRPMGLDPQSPMAALLFEGYAERSPDGSGHFGVVLGKSLTMFASEPTLTVGDLGTVTVPVLVLVGDDDLIELAHTCSLYESIPGAQLAVVPGASHALPLEHTEQTAGIIGRFLEADLPPATMMPSRRL